MRNSLIVGKIFSETLHFLLISSAGYPYTGYQTNAMDTPKNILSSIPPSVTTSISSISPSLAPYATRATNNHISDKISSDKKQFLNDTNKGLINTIQPTENTTVYTTEVTLSDQMFDITTNHSSAIALKLRSTTTTLSSLQLPSSSTTKPTLSRKDIKSILPKMQKTDAPMLNYIFDTFSTANKHHHHDQRYGPHFEDLQKEGKSTNITVQAGGSVYLNCRISLLQDKTVSWVRRNSMGENALDLLTVGLHTYTSDKRYTMEFQYPNNWRLKITKARKEDEAIYECQISTHPPRVIQVHLHVNAPKVMIVDEHNIPLQEKYYEIDSTLQLSCIVRNVVMSSSVVFWRHGEDILNYDTTRGGVSVRTDLMEDGANSSLSIARINKQDSGNYTCSINDSQDYSILVHILKGESFAELHHGTGTKSCDHCSLTLLIIFIMLVLSQTTNTFR